MFKLSVQTLISCGMKLLKRLEIKRTESSDGEIHLILCEDKFNNSAVDESGLDVVEMRKIMRDEAQKPLLLMRE